MADKYKPIKSTAELKPAKANSPEAKRTRAMLANVVPIPPLKGAQALKAFNQIMRSVQKSRKTGEPVADGIRTLYKRLPDDLKSKAKAALANKSQGTAEIKYVNPKGRVTNKTGREEAIVKEIKANKSQMKKFAADMKLPNKQTPTARRQLRQAIKGLMKQNERLASEYKSITGKTGVKTRSEIVASTPRTKAEPIARGGSKEIRKSRREFEMETNDDALNNMKSPSVREPKGTREMTASEKAKEEAARLAKAKKVFGDEQTAKRMIARTRTKNKPLDVRRAIRNSKEK